MADIAGRISTALADRYEIERDLGEGGMAIVFLARDLKHSRKVALKVLRPELAAVIGGERFLKEIEVTAGLQHPHILPLHDSGDADGFLFYVMPYVEGETLRDLLKREKQLAIDEAVAIAKSVAMALDYAHRKGVIHRDIKPENILMNDGQALVADFGIALAVSHASGTRLTETGLSVGTPHYMSPEQAMGDRQLDARSDVYSLGAVLYEMLTGDPPYTGSTAQAIVAKVITEKAPLVTVARDTVPHHVAAAVQKALAKLPADRFHTAAEFGAALTNTSFTMPMAAGSQTLGVDGGASTRPLARRVMVPVALALMTVAAVWGWMRPSSPAPVSRYGLALPPDQAFADALVPGIALAPDASWFVYVGPETPQGRLWVKARDSYEATPLAGSAGAQAPVVSPDGQWIAFFAEAELRRIPAGGGAALKLADSVRMDFGTAAWLDDGSVIYQDASFRLRRVPDGGGTSEIVHTPPAERFLLLPSGLPGGKGLVFMHCDAGCASVSELWGLALGTSEAKMLLPDVAQGWYADGQLVYVRRDGGVFAVGFDPARLELTGAPVPVFEGVQVAGVFADMAISQSGTLLYVAGQATVVQLGLEAVWVSRDGKATRVDTTWKFQTGANLGWSLSPDGTLLAISQQTDAGQDIWIKELDRGPLSRLTLSREPDQRPRWTSDGRSVLFTSQRSDSGGRSLYRRRADGTGADELVVGIARGIQEAVQSRDGEWVILRLSGTSGGRNERDIVAIRPGKDSVPRPLLTESYDEKAPALSPNGRWLAYESNETGRDEIFVRPFPNVGDGKWQVSTAGGRMPLWARSGRELFFMNERRELVAQSVVAQATFQRGEQRVLFTIGDEYALSTHYTPFDISPDDQRFIMVRAVGNNEDTGARRQLILVENWTEELRRKVRR